MTGVAWEVTSDRTQLMALMSCQDSGCHCLSIYKVCCHCCHKGINIDGEHLSHLIFADDIFLVAKSLEDLESMLTDIHLASKPVGLSMNLSKTKVMLNENAITSTVAVDGNTIEMADRYVYLGKTVTQAVDLLPEIKRRIALGWAAFRKVGNIMKSRKACMNIKRKVHN